MGLKSHGAEAEWRALVGCTTYSLGRPSLWFQAPPVGWRYLRTNSHSLLLDFGKEFLLLSVLIADVSALSALGNLKATDLRCCR